MEPIRAGNVAHINSHKSETTVEQLRPLVAELVSDIELGKEFNQELYNTILELDINHQMLHKMLNELDAFMQFDDVPNEVNFPYEEWITQLVLIDDNYKR